MKVLFLFVLLASVISVQSSFVEDERNVRCGVVYDGLTEGKFDIQQQISTTSFGANWSGFGGDVISYEWAIFSEDQVPSHGK